MNNKKNINIGFIITIFCVMLLVGLVGVILYHFSIVGNLETQLNEKDQNIENLNSTITALNLQIIDLEDQLEQVNSVLISLQSNYQDSIQSYLRIITLQESGYLISGFDFSQTANESTQIFLSPLEYAGFVAVNVESNSTTTFVQVVYDSFGVGFDQKILVGEDGVASFPILPGDVEIYVGNQESTDSVSGTVTVNYIY